MRDTQVGETYHPELGPLEEAQILYIRQCGLAERLGAGLPLIIWDAGLGTASNALSAVAAWKTVGGQLELHSFDLDTAGVEFVCKGYREHPERFPLVGQLCEEDWALLFSSGDCQMDSAEGQLRWRWHLGDFVSQVQKSAYPFGRPHLIWYDFHSPARQPELWGLSHWKEIRKHCRDGDEGGTRIISHSRSTALRVTLLLAGFFVGRGSAIGSKEETTVAATGLELLDAPLERSWLKRVASSCSAAPYDGRVTSPSPLPVSLFPEIEAHPQFG